MAAPRPSLLRVVTCGAVDDGKSTLLGRLMLEAGEVPADEVEAAERAGGGEIDPALLFDGLEAEREQGITIGVAFRTLRLGTRVLRLLDAPGHEQYTGNLATAASQADLALLLVDAAEGLKAASRRHALVAELAGVRRLLLVVNKMDLVGWNQDRFEAIRAEFAGFAERLGGVSVEALPVSALLGANVTAASPRMPWWRDGTLRDRLTAETTDGSAEARPLRLPVQLVERDGPRRRYLGSIVSGRLRRGETVRLMPTGRTATVSDLSDQDGPVEEAEAGSAISLAFAEDVDLARGDVIAAEASPPVVSRGFAAKLLWLGAADLVPGRTYDLRLGTASVPAFVTSLRGRVRLETAETVAAGRLAANELGLCEVSLGAALALDPFQDEPATGAFVLLDRADHATVGAGIVLHDLQAETTPQQHLSVGKAGRAALKGQLPTIVWFTGLSGAGKSTLADRLEERLIAQGRHTVLLDGDNIRRGLNRDLGFSEADRIENIRRVGEVAKLMLEGGLIVLCAFISPFRAERQLARSLVDPDEFLEVYVDTPVAECRRRDPKGLYARAQAGEIANFTGISSPYEPPDAPELHLRTLTASVDALTDQILAEMGRRGRLR